MTEMDSDGKIPTPAAKLLIPIPEERKIEQIVLQDPEPPIVVPEVSDGDGIARAQAIPQIGSGSDPSLGRGLRESSILTKRMMGRISERYERGAPDWLKDIDPKRMPETPPDEAGSPEEAVARKSGSFRDRLDAAARHGTAQTLVDLYAFHKGPHLRWMTASLASDHQRLLVQKQVSRDIRHMGAVLEAKLEAVKLNTAAPDIRKMTAVDILRSVSLTQLATQITESAARLVRTNLGPRLARLVSKETQDKAKEYAEGTADIGADLKSGVQAARRAGSRAVEAGRLFHTDPKVATEAIREIAESVKDMIQENLQKERQASDSARAREIARMPSVSEVLSQSGLADEVQADPASLRKVESRFGRDGVRRLRDGLVKTYKVSRAEAEGWIVRHQDKLSSLIPSRDMISGLASRGAAAGGRLKDLISEMDVPDVRESMAHFKDRTSDTLDRSQDREMISGLASRGAATEDMSFSDMFQTYAEEDHRLMRDAISLLTEIRDKEFVLSTGETVQGGQRKIGILGSALGAAGNLGRGYLNLASTVYKGGFGLAGQALGLLSPTRARKEPFTDIFLKDQVTLGEPLLSKRKLEQGVVFADGTPVGDVASIKSVVLDPETGNILISEEDLEIGLVDSFNTPLEKSGLTTSLAGRGLNLAARALGVAGKGAFGFGSQIGALYALPFKLGGQALMGAGRMLFGRGGRGRKYRDVYRKGEVRIGHPLLSKKQLENGVVFPDGKTVRHVEDIDRPVLDRWTGDILISEEDLEHGLVDVFGEPLSRGGQSLAGKLVGTGLGIFGKATGALIDVYKGLYGLGIKGASLGLDGIRGLFGGLMGGGTGSPEDLEDIVGKRLDTINETLKERLPGARKKRLMDPNDLDQDGDDDGSYWDRPRRTTNDILEDILDELEDINKRLTGRGPLDRDEKAKGLLGGLGALLGKGGKGLLAALGLGAGAGGYSWLRRGLNARTPSVDPTGQGDTGRGSADADPKPKKKLKTLDEVLEDVRNGRPVDPDEFRASLLDETIDDRAGRTATSQAGDGVTPRASRVINTWKSRMASAARGAGTMSLSEIPGVERLSAQTKSALQRWSRSPSTMSLDDIPGIRTLSPDVMDSLRAYGRSGRTMAVDAVEKAATWTRAASPASFTDVTQGGGETAQRQRLVDTIKRAMTFDDITRGGGEGAVNKADRALARLALRERFAGIGDFADIKPTWTPKVDGILDPTTGRFMDVLEDVRRTGNVVLDSSGRVLSQSASALGSAPSAALSPVLETMNTLDPRYALKKLLERGSRGTRTMNQKTMQALARLGLSGRNLGFGNIGDFGTPFRHRADISTFTPNISDWTFSAADESLGVLDEFGKPISSATPEAPGSVFSRLGPEMVDAPLTKAQRALARLAKRGQLGVGNIYDTVTKGVPTASMLDPINQFGKLTDVLPDRKTVQALGKGVGSRTVAALGSAPGAGTAATVFEQANQPLKIIQSLYSDLGRVPTTDEAVDAIRRVTGVTRTQAAAAVKKVASIGNWMPTDMPLDPRYGLQNLLAKGSRGAETMKTALIRRLPGPAIGGDPTIGALTAADEAVPLLDPFGRPVQTVPSALGSAPASPGAFDSPFFTPQTSDAPINFAALDTVDEAPTLVDAQGRPVPKTARSGLGRLADALPSGEQLANVFTKANMPLDIQTSVQAALGETKIPDRIQTAFDAVKDTVTGEYGPRVMAQKTGEKARLFTEAFMNDIVAGRAPDTMIPPKDISSAGIAPATVPTTSSAVQPGKPIFQDILTTTALQSGTVEAPKFRLKSAMSKAPTMTRILGLEAFLASVNRPNQSVGAAIVSSANHQYLKVPANAMNRAGRLAGMGLRRALGPLDWGLLAMEIVFMARSAGQLRRDDRPFFIKERMKAYGIQSDDLYKTALVGGFLYETPILKTILAFEEMILEKGSPTPEDIRVFADTWAFTLHEFMKQEETLKTRQDTLESGRRIQIGGPFTVTRFEDLEDVHKAHSEKMTIFKEYLVKWLGERVWPIFKGYLTLHGNHADFISRNSISGENGPHTEVSHNYLVWGLDPDAVISERGKVQAFVNLPNRSGIKSFMETTQISAFLNAERSGANDLDLEIGGYTESDEERMATRIATLIATPEYQAFREEFMTFEAISESFLLTSEEVVSRSSSWQKHAVEDLKLDPTCWEMYQNDRRVKEDRELFDAFKDPVRYEDFDPSPRSDMSGYTDTSRLPPNATVGGYETGDETSPSKPPTTFFGRMKGFFGFGSDDEPVVRDKPDVIPRKRNRTPTTFGDSASLSQAGGAALIPASFGGADPLSFLPGPESSFDMDPGDIGPVPELDPSGRIGTVSKQYESGNKGPAAVGWDNGGYWSYGSYQIATKPGALQNFLIFCKKKAGEGNQSAALIVKEMAPYSAKSFGSDGKRDTRGKIAWQKLAAGGHVQQLEYEFIKSQYYDVLLAKLKRGMPELAEQVQSNRALQEMGWSAAVQHGPHGAYKQFTKIWPVSGGDLPKFVTGVYKERGTYLSKLSSDVKAGVLNRYRNESGQVLALLQKKSETPGPGADDLYAGVGDPDVGGGGDMPATSQMAASESLPAGTDSGGTSVAQAGQVPGSEGVIATSSTSLTGGDPAVSGGGDPTVMAEATPPASEPSPTGDPRTAEMQSAGAVIDYDRMGEVFKSALTETMSGQTGDPEVLAALNGMKESIDAGLGETGAIAMKTQALVDKPVPEAGQNVTLAGLGGGTQKTQRTGISLAHETIS